MTRRLSIFLFLVSSRRSPLLSKILTILSSFNREQCYFLFLFQILDTKERITYVFVVPFANIIGCQFMRRGEGEGSSWRKEGNIIGHKSICGESRWSLREQNRGSTQVQRKYGPRIRNRTY